MQESHCSRDFRAPLAPSALSSPAIVVPPTSWTMPSLPGVHTPKHFEGQRSPHPLGPRWGPCHHVFPVTNVPTTKAALTFFQHTAVWLLGLSSAATLGGLRLPLAQ